MIDLPLLAVLPLAASLLVGFVMSTAMAGLAYLLRPKKQKAEPRQPFGWETTQRDDIPYDWVVGTMPVKGNLFGPWTDAVNTTRAPVLPDLMLWTIPGLLSDKPIITASCHRLHCKAQFGDGPNQGLRMANFRLNGKILSDWPDVTAVERLGTDIQTGTGSENRTEFARNDAVAVGSSVTITMADRDYVGCAIMVGSTDGLCHYGQGSGSQTAAALGCKIEIRPVGGAWHTCFDYYLFARTAYPVRWVFRANETWPRWVPYTVTPGQQHEWRVTCTHGPGDGSVGALRVLAVQEIYALDPRRPGLHYLDLTAINTEDLAGNIQIDAIADGKILESLDGASFAFGAGPAEVLQLAWTQPVLTGDGGATPFAVDYYRGYDPSHLHAADFAALAAWCAALVPNGRGGTEARYEYHNRWSEQTEAHAVAAHVAGTCGAHTWWDGNRVRVWLPTARTPSRIFCDKNMLAGSYEEDIVDTRTRPSAYEATIYDQRADWVERKVKVVDRLAATDIVEQLDGAGCTRESQLCRLARSLFEKARYHNKNIVWQTGPCGLDAANGEVAYVQSDKNGRATGAAVSAVLEDNKVRISTDVTLSVGVAYTLVIQTIDAVNGLQAVAYEVDSLEDARTIVLADNLTYTPVAGDVCIYGATANIDLVRIIATAPDGLGNVTFAGETYDDRMYAKDDDDPYLNTEVHLAGLQPARPLARPLTRQDLMTVYPDGQISRPAAADQVTWGNLTFTGDGIDTVSWAATGVDGVGWVYYRGTIYPVVANAVGTTEKYIGFNPAAADPTLLESTDDRTDFEGADWFLLCINTAGTAVVQSGARIGLTATAIGVEEGADVTGDHADDVTFTGTTPPAHKAGRLWLNPNWCGQDCVGHWRMNDNAASTRVKDESPHGNHGTAQQNTDDLTAAGKMAAALTFNGSSDWIDCGNGASLNFGTGDFAACLWIKTTYTAGDVRLLCKMEGSTGLDFVLASSGVLYLAVWTGPGVVERTWTPPTAVRDGAWHFVGVSVSRDGGSHFFADGSLSPALDFTAAAASISNAVDLLIGRHSGGDTHFNGGIDNVVLYCRALTEDDFDALYDAGTGTEQIGLGSARMLHRSDGTYWLLADSDSPTIPRTADEISESVIRKWAGESGATVGATWNVNIAGQPAGYLVQWQGELAAPPDDPEDGWAYHDTTDGVSYLYHDEAWYFLAVNGAQGTQGVTGAQGAQGVAGAQGSQGPQGTTGAQGDQGGVGNQGVQGSTGAQGSTGEQGSTGATGATGATGDQGAPGATGATGAQGSAGAQGDQGGTGAQGAQGATGATGATGAQGAAGATGAQGNQGVAGAAGATGAQGTQGSTGAQGAQGTQGTTGAQGTQGTTGATGADGVDYQGPWDSGTEYVGGTDLVSFGGTTYICVLTHTNHQPPNETYWDVFALQGTQGSQGAQGSTGTQGNQGAAGAQGATGSQGSQGATGAAGAAGAQGATGAAGGQGNQGATGETGAAGAQGSQGNVGAQGSTGAQGETGATGTTGAQGNQGATGATGVTGAQGNQGATGATGATGSQGSQGNVGAQGSTGTQGNQGATGAQGETGSQGSQGNVGAQGSTGAQGNQGAQGLLGDTLASAVTIAAGGKIVMGTGRSIRLDPDGIKFMTTQTAVGVYGTTAHGGSNSVYGATGGGNVTYGAGMLARFYNTTNGIPFDVQMEQTVADIHLYNRVSDPSGPATIGDLAVVGGKLKICAAAGTPGTWTVVGGQS